MSDAKMLMVICYDIERDKVRRRVARSLEKIAVRVQESVFEARISKLEAEQLFENLKPYLANHDSLRFYGITRAGLQRTMVAGAGVKPSDTDYWLV